MYWIWNTQKNRSKKNEKEGTALHELMNNATWGKNNGKPEKQNQCKTNKQKNIIENVHWN